MTDPIKCDKCGLDYYDKICRGCNIGFRTNDIRQRFHSTICQQANYRARFISSNPKRPRKKPGLVKPIISESQSKIIEKMKRKASGEK